MTSNSFATYLVANLIKCMKIVNSYLLLIYPRNDVLY